MVPPVGLVPSMQMVLLLSLSILFWQRRYCLPRYRAISPLRGSNSLRSYLPPQSKTDRKCANSFFALKGYNERGSCLLSPRVFLTSPLHGKKLNYDACRYQFYMAFAVLNHFFPGLFDN
jgi:hypothetical protein